MMKLFVAVVAFLATSAVAHSGETLASVRARQTPAGLPTNACNNTCAAFVAVKQQCNVPHCGCSNKYLQAQGNCLLCQTFTPEDAASVQFLLDAEINQCHEDGIPIQFKLSLPPDAQALVDKFNRKSENLRGYQMAFLVLQIAGGHVGLVIVLAFALFSRKVRRDTTVLNFCITWIFSSIVYSLLLYRGTRGNTIANTLGEVPSLKCLAQASLINGAQAMTACSTMSLVVQLWLGLRAAIYGDPQGTKIRQCVTYLLLFLPYVFFLAFAIPSVFIGKTTTVIEDSILQRAKPANFYCLIIEDNMFVRAVYGVTLAILLVTVIFDLFIIVILYKHWWAFRHTRAKAAVPLSILLRMIAFSIFRVVVAVAYGTVLDKPPTILKSGSGDALSVSFSVPVWVDMLQATIPFVGFLVLGINSEILSTLICWRKKPTSTASSASTTGTASSAVDTNQNYHARDDKPILDSADARYITSNV